MDIVEVVLVVVNGVQWKDPLYCVTFYVKDCRVRILDQLSVLSMGSHTVSPSLFSKFSRSDSKLKTEM